jgi:hypothetical protein
MNDFTERIAQSIGRHFVTLSCIQYAPGRLSGHPLVFSGFVVDISGEWFYVTAGHILRRIHIAIDSGSSFDAWRLGDQTASNKFQNKAVPYDFELSKWYVLEDDKLGLDYAIVHLGGLFRMMLEAGGVLPFGEPAWGDYTMEHDHWALAGIPSESVSYDDTTQISARFVLAPLVRAEPPPSALAKSANQFYGKLKDDSNHILDDVDGMSGGPIVMLQQLNGTWKYGIIGVQSAWYSSLRVVAGCPFKSFAISLKPIVEDALAIACNAPQSAA